MRRMSRSTTPRRALASLAALAVLAPALPGGGAAPEAGWRHEELAGDVFYQVFVRSFADSDGDGVGDLLGLVERLDYLNDGDPATGGDLGVDGLWLMPVFQSPSYHGYDVVDYLTIDGEYGGNQAFYRLLEEAHRRGMRVIVDFVINHSSREHPWFQAAAASPRSPWRDWYVWRDDDPGWTQPWGDYPTWHAAPRGDGFYYGLFWAGMPDLNAGNPEVRQELARLAEHWLAVGVDGFRLDATRHLFADGDEERQNDRPQTHEFLREFAARVRALDPTAVLVGENWTTSERIAAYYGATDRVAGGDELPLNFNFPLADAIVAAVRDGDAAPVAATLAAMAEHYPPGTLDAPFLRNHDQFRLATELDGDPGRQRLAAAILLTLPGVPFLYYGEEVGLAQGGPGRDDALKRTPMPWDDSPGGGFTTGTAWHPFAPGRERANVTAQSGDPGSLLAHYRRWIRARKASSALRTGTLEPLPAGDPALLAYLRRAGGETALVAHNLAAEARRFGPLPAPAGLPAEPAAGEGRLERRDGEVWLELPAQGSAVWLTSAP